jgi:protease I
MISASDGPSPNTVWVAFFHKGHARQDVASRRKPPRLSVAAAVITFIFYRPLPELKSILRATKSAGAFVFHGDRNNFARGAFAGFSSADRKDTPMPEIRHSRILILATDGFEQLELTVPRDELRKAGAHVDVATPNGNPIRGWNKTDWGETAPADLRIAGANPDNYDALVLPGGVMNPDKLRIDAGAMAVVKSFLGSGKIVAAICHAPWLLIQADAVRDRKMTSFKSVRKDVENAVADGSTRKW